jgi:hypothetical protein
MWPRLGSRPRGPQYTAPLRKRRLSEAGPRALGWGTGAAGRCERRPGSRRIGSSVWGQRLLARRAVATRHAGEARPAPDGPRAIPSPYHVAMSSSGVPPDPPAGQRSAPAPPAERAVLPGARGSWRSTSTVSDAPTDAGAAPRQPTITTSSPSPTPTSSSSPASPSCSSSHGARLARRRSGSAAPPIPLVLLGRAHHLLQPAALSAPFADVVVLGRRGRGSLQDNSSQRLEERPEAARGRSPRPGRPAPPGPRRRPRLLTSPASTASSLPKDRPGPRRHSSRPTPSPPHAPTPSCHDMVLIEPERGCHRGCTFCVMRRSTNGGMRLVAPEPRCDRPRPRRRHPRWAWSAPRSPITRASRPSCAG